MKPLYWVPIVALIGLAWMCRWSEPVPVGTSAALTRDRVTGQLWIVYGDRMYRTQDMTPETLSAPPARR